MKRLIIALALLVSACGTVTPPVRTVEVKIPVPVTCVPKDLPPPPAYPATKLSDLAAMTPDQRYVTAVAWLKLALQRLGETEPVITACR